MSKTLTDKEWKELQRKVSKLECLEAGGVDNWEWYDESLSDWFAENEIEELVDEYIENINDLLAEASVDEPAGRGCGYSISFDEDIMESLLLQFAKQYYVIKTDN